MYRAYSVRTTLADNRSSAVAEIPRDALCHVKTGLEVIGNSIDE